MVKKIKIGIIQSKISGNIKENLYLAIKNIKKAAPRTMLLSFSGMSSATHGSNFVHGKV